MENIIANQEKKKEIITREMITKADGSLDTSIVGNLIRRGTYIRDLPLKVAYYDRRSIKECPHMELNSEKLFKDIMEKHKNWVIYGTYSEVGIISHPFESRAMFSKMIQDAYDHKFDLIITRDISRFSSNVCEGMECTQELLKNGVGVWAINDGILTFDRGTEFPLGIMLAIAQEESRRLYVRYKSNCKFMENKNYTHI